MAWCSFSRTGEENYILPQFQQKYYHNNLKSLRLPHRFRIGVFPWKQMHGVAILVSCFIRPNGKCFSKVWWSYFLTKVKSVLTLLQIAKQKQTFFTIFNWQWDFTSLALDLRLKESRYFKGDHNKRKTESHLI